ncbi:dolichol-phosphate mannosyltransferase subunit 3 [Sipha flava]|uniref:Dolichol-phosphate mannosyltransferase subunit 3 n=1 Tax=Sipha flava TaxID=143950 RepID=A0A8B8FRB2_9HEMI|nr:dolichol-phosphate mannosyltransferase subunit 3 [Sipha flava]
MNKLSQWIFGLNILCVLWFSLLIHQYDNEYFFIIQFIPIILLIVFGVVSLGIILYRVSAFNDCKSAALELQMEIKEAKIALTEKGFKFD